MTELSLRAYHDRDALKPTRTHATQPAVLQSQPPLTADKFTGLKLLANDYARTSRYPILQHDHTVE